MTSPRETRRRWRTGAGLTLFWAALAVYYVFVMSAGRWTGWYTWTAFYDKQAEGFRAGHLYLTEPASAALRALPNPLNPAHMRFWRWDHSFYQGRLYLYWGFVPAALLAAVKALFRIRGVVGDHAPVFAFAMGRAVVGTLLVRALARLRDPAPPRWAVWAATLVFVLANPIPYFLSRGAVYEAAISAGVFFLLGGITCGLRALTRLEGPGGAGLGGDDGAGHGRGAGRLWLAAAGLCFGLGAGSRASLFPAAGLLTAITVLACWRAGGGGAARGLLRASLWGGVPALAVVLAQLTINFLRFGQWSEFGVTYQMGFTFVSGARFIPANLFLYLLAPPVRSCGFPYLMTKWNTGRAGTPDWLPWPADLRIEPTVGLLTSVPFLWLLVFALAVWLMGRRAAAPPAPATPAPRRTWTRRWVVAALVIASTVTALPALLIFSNSSRYEWDFVSGLMLLATLAGWWLLRVPRSRRGRTGVAALFGTLAAASIVVGLLLGFVGYFDNFARNNPPLMAQLRHALDLCRHR